MVGTVQKRHKTERGGGRWMAVHARDQRRKEKKLQKKEGKSCTGIGWCASVL